MAPVSTPQPTAQPADINQQGYTPESMEMVQPRADEPTGMFWQYSKFEIVIKS